MNNTNDSQQSIVAIMLEFVRAAVLDRAPNIPNDLIIDWDRLMDISVDYNMVAWVWDGICKLPDELKPSRRQRINWGLSAQELWDIYDKQNGVLKKIISECKINDIRILLLKGLSLSNLYPNPRSRSCGDIDIFLFDDFEKGNALFGNAVRTDAKHTEFTLEGVVIENHENFLVPNTKQKRKIIKYIKSSLPDVELDGMGYYTLPCLSNIIFLTFHTCKHFQKKTTIPIRNIIDFAFYLKHYSNVINLNDLKTALNKCGLMNSFILLIYLSEEILKVDLDIFKYNKKLQLDKKQISQLLYEYDFVDDRSIFNRKISRLLKKYVASNMNIGQRLYIRLVFIVRYALNFPKGWA